MSKSYSNNSSHSHSNHSSHSSHTGLPNYNETPENNTVFCYDVDLDSEEYNDIKIRIRSDKFVIDSVERVINPFVREAYMAKKYEKMAIYDTVEERWLFHGTKKRNIDSICKYNFNWRYHGNNRGHKFGQGVSFSPSAMYASNYSDPYYNKVMILAQVLVANACVGHSYTVLPPKGFDTTQKEDGSVIVKYEDNEFYPEYKIFYHLRNGRKRKRSYNYNEHYYSYNGNSSYDYDSYNSSYDFNQSDSYYDSYYSYNY